LAHPVPARLSTDYTAAQGQKFGLTVGIAFAVFSAIAWWRDHPRVFPILASLAAVLILAALLLPKRLRVIETTWMKLALLISKVTTPLFMGVLYFVVITPVGVLRRTFGKNALIHSVGRQGLWADRSESPPSELDRLF
jgi:hypothetical protein